MTERKIQNWGMKKSDARMLSSYPAAKILVSCEKCGMAAKYDKLDMLEAGGDRLLPVLLDDIAIRKECEKVRNRDIYDRCYAVFANLV